MWDAAMEMQQSFQIRIQSKESLMWHSSLWTKVHFYINPCIHIVIDRDEQTMGVRIL